MTTPSVILETITPTLAHQWLDHANVHNRSVRWPVVHRYARDMRNGDWHLTGDPVQFSEDGTLHDGQHRLLACAESEVNVRMFVCRGLAQATQQYIDQGVARTPGDALSLSGHPNSAVLGATARIGVQDDTGTLLRDKGVKISHAEILDWVQQHPDVTDAMKTMCAGSRLSRIPLPASVAVYCYYRMCRIDEHDATEFVDALASGANLGPASPVLALHDRLTRLAINRQKLSTPELLALVYRAWNAYRQRRPLGRLQVPPKPIRTLPTLR